MRPLFKVKFNKLVLRPEHIEERKSFRDLMKEGVVEFLDVEEEETAVIAMDLTYLKNSTISYTHC